MFARAQSNKKIVSSLDNRVLVMLINTPETVALDAAFVLPLVRESVCRVKKATHMAVVHAFDVDEGMKVIGDERANAVAAVVVCPSAKDGPGAVRDINTRFPEAAVLNTMASVSEEDKKEALSGGGYVVMRVTSCGHPRHMITFRTGGAAAGGN